MASRIDGLAGSRGVAIDNNQKPNAEGNAQSEKTENTQSGAKSDTVALTAEAKSFQQLGKKAASQEPYFDRERVDAIKQSIAEGQYAVDAQRVADKFMETEQLLGKV